VSGKFEQFDGKRGRRSWRAASSRSPPPDRDGRAAESAVLVHDIRTFYAACRVERGGTPIIVPRFMAEPNIVLQSTGHRRLMMSCAHWRTEGLYG